jgi:hypothetical protein
MILQTSEQNDNFGNGSEYTEHDFGEEFFLTQILVKS